MSTLNTILVVVNLAHLLLAAEYPCNVTLSVDISDGERDGSNGNIIKDGVTYTNEQYFEYEGKTMGCVCNFKPCIKKCCPLGKYMTSNKECVDTQENFMESIVKFISADINTYSIINVPCNTRSLVINPQDEEEKVLIEANGNLVWGDSTIEEQEEIDSYCVDYIEDTKQLKVLVCDILNGDEESNTHNSIGISYNLIILRFIILNSAS